MVSQETHPCSQVKKSCVLIKWRTESFDETHFHRLKMYVELEDIRTYDPGTPDPSQIGVEALATGNLV